MPDIAYTREQLAASIIAGGYTPGGAGGAVGYAANTGATGFNLSSSDNAGTAAAAVVGINTIDIQTSRTTNVGAQGTNDIVIGSTSGASLFAGSTAPAAATTYGNNIVLGVGSIAEFFASTTTGKNVVIGSGAKRTIGTGSTNTADGGQDIIIGSGATMAFTGGQNILIGSLTTATSATLNASLFRCAFVGFRSTMSIASGAAAGSKNGLVSFGYNASTTTISDGGFVARFGVNNVLQGTHNYNALIGIGGILGTAGAAVITGVTRISAFNGTSGTSPVYITMVANPSTVSASATGTIYLGCTAEAHSTSPGVSAGGGNVVYGKAMADIGTVFAASTASYVIPDNTSTVILTGTTNTAITMPVNPIDGQKLEVVFDGAQTPTWSANTGQTLRNAPSGAIAAGVTIEWRYNLATTTGGGVAAAWYRIR